jgi:hypothetical protein
MSDAAYIAIEIIYGLIILLMLGGAFVFFTKSAKEKRAKYHKQWKRRHLKLIRGDNDRSKK